MSDQDIQELENQFPALSGSAFAAARRQALEAGLSVVESQDGVIYEAFPNGRREVVKKIEPPAAAVTGSIYLIR